MAACNGQGYSELLDESHLEPQVRGTELQDLVFTLLYFALVWSGLSLLCPIPHRMGMIALCR